jgi:hypothetical protein
MTISEKNSARTTSGIIALAKVDLHVHVTSRNGEEPWKRYAVPTIERVFFEARARGMRFVTITEHNSMTSSLILKHLWPEDSFTGVEVTTLFPEDGGRAHVLVYGLREAEFEEIRTIRKDIYELRHFLKERRIASSVAHAVHSVETKDLNVEHLEKLLLLFDVFEVVNGGCSYGSNHIWANLLKGLTPDCMEKLAKRHRIQPMSDDSWMKGFTGGSDDHAEGEIGNIYTVSPASSIEEFMDDLRSKLTFVGETHGVIRNQHKRLETCQTDAQKGIGNTHADGSVARHGFKPGDIHTEAA